MTFGSWSFCGRRLPARHRAWVACAILFVAFWRLALLPALADGCFVFRWNKGIDIKEPAQKAIIVHDAGREDLLLQVKYEGPLKEFGWLIPVPGLPTVEKGSMRPFYELSQLTQRQWGGFDRANTLSAGIKGVQEETVKVIEVKTVGAYEVAVLSALEAGSLERWLKAHDFSIPEGKAGIIDEYIRKSWYFIAAKINVGKAVSLQRVSGTTPKDTEALPRTRNTIQKQLSSGELHPLLISFDTTKCIYPLRISAMSGKPSEVSLYVLSAEARLDKFIYDQARQKLAQRRAEWEQRRPERAKNFEICKQNLGAMMVSWVSFDYKPREQRNATPARDWSVEDLVAISKEGRPPASPSAPDDEFYASPQELVQCLRVAPEQIPQCIKDLPRLKGKSWHLTKQVWTFRPGEMHDLQFQPTIPVCASELPGPVGAVAARLLAELGTNARPVLVTAWKSSNSTERINASWALGYVQGERLAEPLLSLLRDEMPRARLNAVEAAARNWAPGFTAPLIALFRDPYSEIRTAAAECLGSHEPADRAAVYLELLKGQNPDVQFCALRVLGRINRTAVPRAELLRLLGSSRMDNVNMALSLLKGGRSAGWTYEPAIVDPRFQTPKETNYLSSVEAAPLTTNRLTMARLMGLKILRQNADAQAVALTLPLLRDTNSLVRNRAFALLQTVSGQDIPQNDLAKWDQWWARNKDTFVVRKPAP
jgi:hypothetical protein